MSGETRVTLTGTGVPHPSPGRAGPGAMVRRGDVVLQFDAGRGTVLRMTEAGAAPPKMTALFLTHVHSDHLVDVADVLLTKWIMQHLRRSARPVVVAPDGHTADFVRRVFDIWADDIAVRRGHTGAEAPEIDLVVFPAPADPTEVWVSDDGEVRVDAVAVHHEPVQDAVAYRVRTPEGVVVISGDTRVCAEVEQFSRGASVLVHEACRATALADAVRDTPFEHIFSYHADTVALGGLATRAGVEHLVLTHLIPPPTNEGEERGFADDVRSGGWQGALTVGRDLDEFVLRDGRVEFGRR